MPDDKTRRSSRSAAKPLPFPDLPEEMAQFLARAIKTPLMCHYCTVNAKGVPIDSPVLPFIGLDGRTVDLTSGLAYPYKAERARRNPHVGLLFEGKDKGEGGPPAPVILIAAMATVKDSDLQANTERFTREEIEIIPGLSAGLSWQTIRRAVHYLVRIYIHCTPVRVFWWPDGNTDQPPVKWQAAAGLSIPPSDPAPPGVTAPAPWAPVDWRERAKDVVAKISSPHLIVVDDEGFPLPLRTKKAALASDGFDLDLPAWLPWSKQGPASLSFADLGNFLGTITPTATGAHLTVERCLGDLPHGPAGGNNAFVPEAGARKVLMKRLRLELVRRGKPMPRVRKYARRTSA